MTTEICPKTKFILHGKQLVTNGGNERIILFFTAAHSTQNVRLRFDRHAGATCNATWPVHTWCVSIHARTRPQRDAARCVRWNPCVRFSRERSRVWVYLATSRTTYACESRGRDEGLSLYWNLYSIGVALTSHIVKWNCSNLLSYWIMLTLQTTSFDHKSVIMIKKKVISSTLYYT